MRAWKWVRIPSGWILDNSLLPSIIGRADSNGSVGVKIGALMTYIAIAMTAVEEESFAIGSSRIHLRSVSTYDELQRLTGLSRPLLSKSLLILEQLLLVSREASGRGTCYTITGFKREGGWCKIPVQALIEKTGSGPRIQAFTHFTKRGLVELYALKLFLYLLATRNNERSLSNVSFESISNRTGIPRKAIRKTGSFLLNVGLLSEIQKRRSDDSVENNANCYYVTGHKDLLSRS